MFQMRQIGQHASGHCFEIEATIGFRNDENLGLAEVENVLELMLAKDWHNRVRDGASARAGERQSNEFPPVQQLVCDDIAVADANCG
jgi:hypothetical protein